jgi:hypothetical protein
MVGGFSLCHFFLDEKSNEKNQSLRIRNLKNADPAHRPNKTKCCGYFSAILEGGATAGFIFGLLCRTFFLTLRIQWPGAEEG